MGRLTSESTVSCGTKSYEYNELNIRKKITNARGQIRQILYDSMGRITGYTSPEGYGKVIRYEYDAVGNLPKTIYPDNTAVTYAYDANHNLIRVTDWANRVTSYTYGVNNRVVGVTKPDGSVTTTIYDNKQRVTSTVEKTAGCCKEPANIIPDRKEGIMYTDPYLKIPSYGFFIIPYPTSESRI